MTPEASGSEIQCTNWENRTRGRRKIKIKNKVGDLLLLGVSICFSSTRHEPYPPMQMGLGVIQNMSPAGDLTKNLFVWQNFASPYDVLSGVVLFMATYVRPILSTLTIRLTQAECEQALITFQNDS